jgi:hypothetical protein
MKTRTVILVAMAATLLLGSVTLGRDFGKLSRSAQGSPLERANEPPPVKYIVAQGVTSGGSYHLTSSTWQVKGDSQGGRYRLLESTNSAPYDHCCCVYLPCVKK